MAKIIYGLSGQGFGHSARSKEVISHLISLGHEVKIFTYGQSLFLLAKEFGDEKIFEIPGFTLSYKNNKLVYWQTVCDNVKKIMTQSRQWKKIKNAFIDFNPEIVITDFEPITALLAKFHHRRLVSIDNQHQMTNTALKVSGSHKKDLAADKLIIKSMVWGAEKYLVTTFYPTPITKKNTELFAPLIRQEILNLKTTNGDYILVYKGADFDHIIPILKNSSEKYVVFGSHPESVDGNITFKGFAVEEWLEYLSGAKAVIGTAGLSLMCECIYLKKPYLAIPINRQVEQIINAQYLQRLNYGLFTYDFTADDLSEFINNLDHYKSHLASADALGNSVMFKRLDKIIG